MKNLTSFDSSEELYFSYFIEELQEKGIITAWQYHPKPFHLSDRSVHVYENHLKTKVVLVDSVILNDHKYQADFILWWNKEWIRRVYIHLGDKINWKSAFFIASDKEKHFSVIDVKGSFAGPRNSTAITFPLNQKWVYQKYGIYVQKVIPKILFAETFTPRRYLLTDTSGKPRVIKFKTRSIAQYMDIISK